MQRALQASEQVVNDSLAQSGTALVSPTSELPPYDNFSYAGVNDYFLFFLAFEANNSNRDIATRDRRKSKNSRRKRHVTRAAVTPRRDPGWGPVTMQRLAQSGLIEDFSTLGSGRHWIRTSDLCGVNTAL